MPGSGGFLLTEAVPYLEEYFVPGREVGVFTGPDDLLEQVAHWLERPDERAAVAEAGYRRALSDHTYDRRFEAIFSAAGLGLGGSCRAAETADQRAGRLRDSLTRALRRLL